MLFCRLIHTYSKSHAVILSYAPRLFSKYNPFFRQTYLLNIHCNLTLSGMKAVRMHMWYVCVYLWPGLTVS